MRTFCIGSVRIESHVLFDFILYKCTIGKNTLLLWFPYGIRLSRIECFFKKERGGDMIPELGGKSIKGEQELLRHIGVENEYSCSIPGANSLDLLKSKWISFVF